MTRHYSPAINAMMTGGSWDGTDPWGSAMELAWSLAQVSAAVEVDEPVMILSADPGYAGWPTMEQLLDPDDETTDAGIVAYDLASAYQAGEITDDDLIFAARVLNRYIDQLNHAGLSY